MLLLLTVTKNLERLGVTILLFMLLIHLLLAAIVLMGESLLMIEWIFSVFFIEVVAFAIVCVMVEVPVSVEEDRSFFSRRRVVRGIDSLELGIFHLLIAMWLRLLFCHMVPEGKG